MLFFMSTARRIAKNTSLMLTSQIITYILGFFITLYTARYLGVGNFGILSLALSLTGIFVIFTDLGLGTLIVREVARDKSVADKYISNIALMKILLTIFTLGLTVLTVNILGYNDTVKNVIYIITYSIMIGTFIGFLAAIFQANEKMFQISISNILTSVTMLISTFIGIYYGLNLNFFASIYLISNILIFIYIFSMYIRTFSLPQIQIDLTLWKPTLKEAWPFGITSISAMLYTYIDSIMLSVIQGTEAVGVYSAAYRIMLVMLFIPNAVNLAIFPVMSQYYESSKDSLRIVHERYFKYMILLGVPIGAGTTILASKIILLIFGQGFTQSVIVLQILIWTIVLTFAGASFVQLLQSTNKQIVITKISGICVVINIVINLLLIPKYSYIGASFATLLTEIILVGYIIFASYKLGYGIDPKVVKKDLSKVLTATFVMSAVIWYFNGLNLFILVITGIFIYFITLYLVKGIDKEDVYLVKKILNKD
jgi:O-antigen/teichoic acid export membrane protein